MKLAPIFFLRRLVLAVLGLCVGMVVLLYVFRRPVVAAAADSALRRAGAADIRLTVAQASPWRVELADIGFRIGSRPFAARRLTIARAHWWTPSLGAVRISQAKTTVAIPLRGAGPSGPTAGAAALELPAVQIPAEEISIAGHLVVQVGGLPEQAVTVKLDARRKDPEHWEGKVEATAPGLQLAGTAGYALAERALDFRVGDFTLDLKTWTGFVRDLVGLPGGSWEFEGRLRGTAEGRVSGKDVTLAARMQLRDGSARNAAKAVTATGIEADLEFDDLRQVHTPPGQTVRVRELQTGDLVARDLELGFAVEGAEKIAVSRATMKALGGSIAAETFTFHPNRREVQATLLADGLDVTAIISLAKDVPAQASGRVSGRLPIRIDASGLRLGTGWLQLTPGVSAEIRFNANGLLTGGLATTSASYAVMQKLESGLLRLRLNELRLEIYPPNSPPGRTAQLHLAGEPLDPGVKAPVTLDLNVNGPLEKLLNVGLDSRVSIGQKR